MVYLQSASLLEPMFSTQGNSSPSPKLDHHQWIVQIRQTLAEADNGDTGDDEVPATIFAVPKSLMAGKPERYIPQQVAIGPYHQWRAELFDMERYKLMSAKRTKKLLRDVTFEDVAVQFMKLDSKIRASYDRYLNLDTETLAWVMAVDASFLLDFLQIYTIKTINDHDHILRDMIMLENQVPLFVLKEMLGFYKYENPSEILALMLMGICRSLSHFIRADDFTLGKDELLGRDHLLGLLYHASVPKPEEICIQEETKNRENLGGYFGRLSNFVSVFLRSSFYRYLVWVLGILKSFARYPLKIIGKLPKLSVSTDKLSNIVSSAEKVGRELEAESIQSTTENLLIEEIMIPSVSDLTKAGVQFSATTGDMGTIKFDNTMAVVYLPKIKIDENSDVLLRNLVAYEAAVASGPLVFSRYTEFMNGIIDTEEDVKLLRGKDILYNHLKTDEEVANLWNGMSKSLRLTKVPHLDKVIEDVNLFYNSRWKVRSMNLVKKYVFRSWPLLTFLAANVFLVLTGMQAFCSFYNCSGIGMKMAGSIPNSTLPLSGSFG